MQTYPNRELLIVADGADVRDLVPADDDSIRLLHIREGYTIGDKRNFGCEHARGSVIAHWDDDDYSAPGRLADQLQRLDASGQAVTGYYSMRFTAGSRWWLFRGARCYSLGTSLCYRRDWWAGHKFRALQIGEDNQFVGAARDAQQLATAEAGDLMFARVHAGNTSVKNTSGDGFQEL